MNKQERIDTVVNGVNCGMTDGVIAGMIGVTPATFRRWIAKGSHEDPAVNYEFRELAAAYHQAKGLTHTQLMGNVLQFAQRDWRAATWAIERLYPDDTPAVQNLVDQRLKSLVERLAVVMPEELFNEFTHYLCIVEDGSEIPLQVESSEESQTINVRPIAS
jgi:hypothetical protein